MSNSNKVTVNNLSSAIMKYLQEYREDIQKEVKELTDKNIKEAKNELKSISPKSSRTVHLRKSNNTEDSNIVKSRKLCKIMDHKKWQEG